MVSQDVRNLYVVEMTGRDKKSLIRCLIQLDSPYMSERQVAHIDPEEGHCGWDLVFRFAGQDVRNAQVGCVEVVQPLQIREDGPQHERRIHRREREVRLFLLHEVPRRLLSQGLGPPVAVGPVRERLLLGDGVPVCFGVGVAGPVSLERIDNGGEGGCDDHPFDSRRTLPDGFEDAGRSDDGRVQHLGLRILEVVVEGGRGVDDGVKGRIGLDDFIKGRLLSDVLHDDIVELVLADVGVVLEDVLALGFGSHARDDGMTGFEKFIDDMSGDEAPGSSESRHDILLFLGVNLRAPCYESARHGCNGGRINLIDSPLLVRKQ